MGKTNSRLVELSEFSSLIVEGISLDFKSPVRNLGILFDSTLSMKNQLDNVKKNYFKFDEYISYCQFN